MIVFSLQALKDKKTVKHVEYTRELSFLQNIHIKTSYELVLVFSNAINLKNKKNCMKDIH